ncbi:hypothetical protein [Lentisalinibacter salinarum]|uniref:hypothetical protein n=1 Tax=Lentisalinibacter salinarum TaxID=2992239 RepID=UPI00386D2760
MKTVAILFHEAREDPAGSTIHHLAEFWREAGIEVIYLFGTKRFVPADLVIVHVNLSVVPPYYLEFADRYPIALNRQITDIRKSTFSTQTLEPGDRWTGPVLVKSDLNFGGVPEKSIGRSWIERHWEPAKRFRAAMERRIPTRHPFARQSDYRLFSSLSMVPREWFKAKDVIVEKFTPEIENDLYYLRMYQVLGDRWTCTRVGSPEPLVKAHNSVIAADVEPHPVVEDWRRKLGLDYGKLDYVVVDGSPILLDVNKTTGSSPGYREANELSERRRHLAEGLKYYFSN